VTPESPSLAEFCLLFTAAIRKTYSASKKDLTLLSYILYLLSAKPLQIIYFASLNSVNLLFDLWFFFIQIENHFSFGGKWQKMYSYRQNQNASEVQKTMIIRK
jgi:hypothetical protein